MLDVLLGGHGGATERRCDASDSLEDVWFGHAPDGRGGFMRVANLWRWPSRLRVGDELGSAASVDISAFARGRTGGRFSLRREMTVRGEERVRWSGRDVSVMVLDVEETSPMVQGWRRGGAIWFVPDVGLIRMDLGEGELAESTVLVDTTEHAALARALVGVQH